MNWLRSTWFFLAERKGARCHIYVYVYNNSIAVVDNIKYFSQQTHKGPRAFSHKCTPKIFGKNKRKLNTAWERLFQSIINQVASLRSQCRGDSRRNGWEIRPPTKHSQSHISTCKQRQKCWLTEWLMAAHSVRLTQLTGHRVKNRGGEVLDNVCLPI